MRRPSLRSQLNQIRLWVRQGRTDAWIAHKLDIPVGQLEQFKREHLSEPEPPPDSVPEPSPVDEPPAIEDLLLEPAPAEDIDDMDEAEPEDDERESPAPARRRRRGRRGGRRRAGAKPAVSFEGTFDHGAEGYGLWLDPAIADSEVYEEHWAGHRAVEVTVESNAITIRRVDGEE